MTDQCTPSSKQSRYTRPGNLNLETLQLIIKISINIVNYLFRKCDFGYSVKTHLVSVRPSEAHTTPSSQGWLNTYSSLVKLMGKRKPPGRRHI